MLTAEALDELPIGDSMVWHAPPEYSKSQVVNAGKALRTDLVYSAQAVDVFRIAHNWRACHLLPMVRLRQELTRLARKIDQSAVTAARLKRMSSVRRKLRRAPENLYQMQDIGGCRVIMDNQNDIDRLIVRYRGGASRYEINREQDYIARPKAGGYRGHHIVLKFHGQGVESVYNERSIRIEMQFRTRLQHVWATAVEAVGMVRNEELKSGEGCPDWLRLFQLMASEFAVEERSAIVGCTPTEAAARNDELKELNQRLSAVEALNRMNNAFRIVDQHLYASSRFYLIQFDAAKHEVRIVPKSEASSVSSLNQAETSGGSVNSVLVDVGRVSDLRDAYPNYFLDVGSFSQRLSAIVEPPAKKAKFDAGWLSRWIAGMRA